MTAVVPKIYLDLGWPYAKRPSHHYQSPSGTLTFAPTAREAPCNVDREILLYIANIANEARSLGMRARGSVDELAAWLGAQRRPRRVRQRLLQVVSYRVAWKRPDGQIRMIRIAELKWNERDNFDLILDRDFHESCLRGVPYSIELATNYRKEPALLDLYLALMDFVHEIRQYGEFTHEFFPYEKLPLASADRHARSDLAERVEKLRTACPGAYFTMAPTGLGIWVDIGQPKRIVRAGVSRHEWEENDRYGRMIRRLPPEHRRELGNIVALLQETMARLDNHGTWAQIFATLEQTGRVTDQVFARLGRKIEEAHPKSTADKPESEEE